MATIDSILSEKRVFPPPAALSENAHVKSLADYEALCRRADSDPEGFWADIANKLVWRERFTQVLDWDPPDARWFVGGKLNITESCLDRHLAERGDKLALIWEGEPGDVRTFTYRELFREVCRAANMLSALGVRAGDRVAIYLPLIPEAAVAMLACARIGAVHSVVFGGFSAEALADRIRDAGAKVLITADGGYRRGKVIPLKDNADRAAEATGIERMVVVKRCANEVAWNGERDGWWHELCAAATDSHEAVVVDSEHPLFILYTSGTTGKPKGILHTTAGYLVGTSITTKLVFDLHDDDIYWCTADVGWVTGHSYVVYGPLANGATTVMYEGAPNHPAPDRFWKLIEDHKITILYTAPTAIRTFMRWGDAHPQGHDLSSLRILGTVGEPINPEAWMWYWRVIGQERCPVVDTWWQTETGAIMISPLPGATPTRPGSATRPLPGIAADVVRKDGTRADDNEGGYLVIKRPWPSMLRGIYGDHDRYVETYFSKVSPGTGLYFAGDGARRDEDGNFWIMGRVDDVLNVSGHRLSTMEVESALVSHPKVAEAAVVAQPDEVSGQAICAFVTPMAEVNADEALADELRRHVADQIGALARPKAIRFADALPKTRSGKIMRRLLRDIAAGSGAQGDTSTLENEEVLRHLASAGEED
ncbi:MAG TPA: acetate--CoA ligase [Kofleriaceae bacterium]|nr:acetate--CoA ligase [Kofleriaceae bacterium]